MNYSELKVEWEHLTVGDSDGLRALSSGSTGNPKEISLSKELLLASAHRTINFFNLDSSSHLHSCISPQFIGGKMQAIRAWLIDADFSFEEPSNRPTIVNDFGAWPDLVAVVPSQMLHVLENFTNIPSSCNFLIGGSAVDSRLRKRIAENKINGWETYGMTETASHIAIRKIETEVKPFMTLQGISINLSSNSCLIIESDETGIILTNDIAEKYGENRFNILGRLDNVIICGGRKIHPEEVENKIHSLIVESNELSHYASSPMMLSSKPDIKWGEMPILLLENFPESKVNVLRNILKANLPDYQIPKDILTDCKIPFTDNGKIMRKAALISIQGG